jgi:hypothetical protein
MHNETSRARRDPITIASLAFGILAALTLPVPQVVGVAADRRGPPHRHLVIAAI